MIKTSMEKVTYSVLVDNLCRKTKIDKATSNLKISYFPLGLDPKRPSYILDDEDVFGFLLDVNESGYKNLLYVELIKDVKPNDRSYDTKYTRRKINELDRKGGEHPMESVGSNEVVDS
ncbi:MULE transposase N-terminal all-beta domain [Arabidopsis suecica]|uniref:MULE transposase N-terminal all-beta domain n=1 Tax=Arabidopsis suecica TaxID=45249 RepID=A0A8T1ZWM4_ARASU|nr:MULE transposase N-terminal all-beta domain [Arabidopsis suecica]